MDLASNMWRHIPFISNKMFVILIICFVLITIDTYLTDTKKFPMVEKILSIGLASFICLGSIYNFLIVQIHNMDSVNSNNVIQTLNVASNTEVESDVNWNDKHVIFLENKEIAKIETKNNSAKLVPTTKAGKAMVTVLKYVNHSDKYVKFINVEPYGTFANYADSTGKHKVVCYVNNHKSKDSKETIILKY